MSRAAVYNFNAIPAPEVEKYRGVERDVAENEAEFRRSLERWTAMVVQSLTSDPLGPSGFPLAYDATTDTITLDANVQITGDADIDGTLALAGATISGAPTWSTLQTLNTSGNAATATLAAAATVLAAARTINGVSFDGSANITVPAAAGTLTGTTLAANVVTSSLTTIGTLVAGSVPASLVTTGTFGAGGYVFPGALDVTGLLTTTLGITTGAVILPTVNEGADLGDFTHRFFKLWVRDIAGVGTDIDMLWAQGSTGSSPGSARTLSIIQNVTSNGTFPGTTLWAMKRAGVLVYEFGVSAIAGGISSDITDLVWAPVTFAAPTMALTAAGLLKTLAGISTTTGVFSGLVTASAGWTVHSTIASRSYGFEEYGTNADTDFAFNYNGYLGAGTRFRDFVVYDGKQNLKLRIAGSTGLASFTNAVTVSGLLTANGIRSAGTSYVRVEDTASGGPPAGSTGVGHEFYVDSGIAFLQSYNRTGAAFSPQGFQASSFRFYSGDVTIDSLLTASAGATLTNGDLKLGTAGNGIYVKEGTNATMGRAVMVGGTVTVSTTKVTSVSEIFLTTNVTGGTIAGVYVSARTAGTSFVITSLNILDTSTVSWLIMEPA